METFLQRSENTLTPRLYVDGVEEMGWLIISREELSDSYVLPMRQ